VDILDDVLLMDEAVAAPGIAPGGEAPPAARGLDQWLAGMLPGGGGAEAASAAFVEDVLGEDAGDDDLDAPE
jgi:hypothetical protein